MESRQMTDLLLRMRHDFANHLQVVGGYLDLGQAQRARDYLRTVVDEINNTRIIFAGSDHEAALYFYQQVLIAGEMGFRLRYENTADDHWQILRRQGEPQGTLCSISQEGNSLLAEELVQVHFSPDAAGLTVRFTFPYRNGYTRIIRLVE